MATHNLAIAIGVPVAVVLFARRVAQFVTVGRAVEAVDGQETVTCVVDGELFFASSNNLSTPGSSLGKAAGRVPETQAGPARRRAA